MSEDQLRWERLEDELRRVADVASEIGGEANDAASIALGAVANAIAKATDHPAPPPDAVPELPEWVEEAEGGHWFWVDHDAVHRRKFWLVNELSAADLDRIAEACRILAVRRRANP